MANEGREMTMGRKKGEDILPLLHLPVFKPVQQIFELAEFNLTFFKVNLERLEAFHRLSSL
jgi:hypothetical protein